MLDLFPFFIIILAGLFFSSIFGKFRIPWVVTLIIAGFIIGPFGLDLFVIDKTIDFFAHMGLIFLMFLTGLEVNLSTFREKKKEILKISALNGGLPFLIGFSLLWFWGYNIETSFLFGIIFISSSVAIIIPSFYANKLFGTKIGNTTMAAVIFQDILSLFLLSLLLHLVSPTISLPLLFIYVLLFVGILFIKWFISKINYLILHIKGKEEDNFEKEFRLVLVILFGIIVFFQFFGLHVIIAAFLGGLILSDIVKNKVLKTKLHVMGYGVFIPIFFVVIGMETNLGIFKEMSSIGLLLFLIILGSIFSKFIGGVMGARVAGFNLEESLLTGSATIPQLSTTLAAVFAGFEVGIIDSELVAIMVFLSIITTFIGPVLLKIIVSKINKEKIEKEEILGVTLNLEKEGKNL